MIHAKVLEIITAEKFKVIMSGVNPRYAENLTLDKVPFPDDKVMILQVGNDPNDLHVIAVNDGVVNISESGENRIYSYDVDKNILASVFLNKEAEVVVNSGEDWAVKYSTLETAYNELQEKVNALVNLYNAHIHVTTATVGLGPIGVLSPPASAASASSGDIAATKVEKVRLP